MPKSSRLRMVASAVLLGLFLHRAILAQTSSASITGTVLDSAGAVVPNAEILLTSIETATQRRTNSNTSGNYVFLNLLPGGYKLKVTAQGFRTAEVPSVDLVVNQTAALDFHLEVGAITESVTVSAVGAQVQSSTAELGTVVSERQVVDLPLNGRNFTQLLTLTPGASPVNVSQNASGFTAAAVGQFSYPSMNGQTNRSNVYTLDGVFNTGPVVSTPAVEPIIDTIQEFKVQSHNDSAEFGGANGAIVNVATKSGTNELHGTAWEFLRNDALDARNTFLLAKPTFRQNMFGATAGGPAIKNKAFFFLAYQGFRFRRPASALYLVPTPQNLQGDLSDIPRALFDPRSTRVDPNRAGSFLRNPFPSNRIPPNMLDAGVLKYVQATVPLPIVTGVTSRNALDNTPVKNNQEEFNARGDYNFREKDQVFFRWSEARFDGDGTAGRQTVAKLRQFRSKNVAGSWVHTFGPVSVLQVQVGRILGSDNSLNRLRAEAVADRNAFVKDVGFAARYCCSFFADGSEGGVLVPDLQVPGYFTGGEGASLNKLTNVWQYKASYSHIRGNHTFKFGGEYGRVPRFLGGPRDSITVYQAAQTADPQNQGTTGSPLASFLMDVPNEGRYRNANTTTRPGGVLGFFFQDQWKATPRLTVNWGLRYDRTFVPQLGREDDPSGNIFVGAWDLNRGVYTLMKKPPSCAEKGRPPCIPTPDGSLPAHVEVSPDMRILRDYTDNWQPRLGLAYKLTKRTAIRTGFGLYFDSWAGVVEMAQNFGATWPSVGVNLASNLNAPTVANPTPTISGKDPVTGTTFPAPNPYSQASVYSDPNYHNPYSIQWNFGIQHQMTNDTVLSLTYAGSGTRRLGIGGYYNTAVTPGPGLVSARQPFPYVIPTFFDKSIGRSSYNSLQFTMERRYSGGLSYLVSYTWSKTISIGCDGWYGVEGCSVQNPYDVTPDRSIAAMDLPHILRLSWVYELPFGPGKPLSPQSKALGHIIGNWQVNGIASFFSGVPYTVGVAGDIANTGNFNLGGFYERLNLVGDPVLSNPVPGRWFNQSAFASPAAFTFGNSGRNILRGDGTSNFDLSVFRRFQLAFLREGMQLDFRAEMFNAFNSPVYARPGNNLSLPTFGIVTGTANPARQVQLALKLIF